MLKQISVFLPNFPGQLADFLGILIFNKIFIRSLTVAETEEYGMLLLLVDQYEKCVSLFEKKNILNSVTEVIAVRLSDNISEVYKIAKILGAKDINIEYLYTFSENSDHPRTITVLRLDDNKSGVRTLEENGFEIVR